MQGKPTSDKVSSRKETEAGAEISALVNYVQPVHFISFEVAKSEYQNVIAFKLGYVNSIDAFISRLLQRKIVATKCRRSTRSKQPPS